MNTFQKFMLLPKNKHILQEVVKIYHPDIEDKYLDEIKIGTMYKWITIDGKGVSIGIEFNPGFSGMGWKMSDFVKAYNTKKFRTWRFADDSKYVPYPNSNDPEVHDLLISRGVPKPTPTEMFKYYYSD